MHIKVNLFPIQGMKAHEKGEARVYIFAELGRDVVASPTPGCLRLVLIYRRLSGSEEQSGYEGVRKISTPPSLGIEAGCPVCS